MPATIAAFDGFLLGAGLIIAIGAQNAFVLRQGLIRSHVFAVCLTCFLSDAVLIVTGVGGLGALLARSEKLVVAVTVAGAVFLFVYGLLAFRRATTNTALATAGNAPSNLASALSACLAFTFLNPHVYLDTVFLIGAIAAGYAGSDRTAFAGGAVFASFAWFFGLGFGARRLAPLFTSPTAWRALDIFVGTIMCFLAATFLARLV